MTSLVEHQTSLPSQQYGAYESSYDQYPDERRWAKRFALRRLRELLVAKAREGRIIVRDFRVVEHFESPLGCETWNPENPPYTYGWKCHITLWWKE